MKSKQISLILTIFLLSLLLNQKNLFAQQICNPAGNVVIYSNYDGGPLNINVDVDIPNLKIGIVSYSQVNITISGTYASNITEIRYAGHNSSPTIMGYSGVLDVYTSPSVNISNPNGHGSVICCYSCDTSSSQGGCCTSDQIADYFLQAFGGDLYLHLTQYAAWSGTNNISTGGNCCVGVLLVTEVNNYVHSAHSISVYPNPSKDIFYLEGDSFENLRMEDIRIYDILGKKQQLPIHITDEASTIALDFSSVSKGIYFIQIENGEEIYSTKIILE